MDKEKEEKKEKEKKGKKKNLSGAGWIRTTTRRSYGL